MSRRFFVVFCAVIMVALTWLAIRIFSEPVPYTLRAPTAKEEGPKPEDFVPNIPRPVLPPASAMHMSAGDSLPVTEMEPAPPAEPHVTAPLVSDRAAGSTAITQPSTPPAPEAAKPAPPAAAESAPAKPAPAAPDPAAAQPAAEPSVPQASATSAASATSGQAAAPERAPLVSKTSLPAKAGINVVTSATLTMDGDTVVLRLQGNAPLRGKAFLMGGPDRAVLDLQGVWSAEAPKVTSNRMVQALRVGNQGQTTRFVFDMRVKPGKVSLKQVNDKTLELTIR